MKNVVIKIGGSLLYNDELLFNKKVVQNVIDWYKKQKEYSFVAIVVGGGKISRFVVEQVKPNIERDYFRHKIGMKMTQVNAAIVHGIMGDDSCGYFDNLDKFFHFFNEEKMKIAVLGGTKVGGSTDMISAEIAKHIGAEVVNKISNISNVYTGDPRSDSNAKSIDALTWDEYAKLFGGDFEKGHKPGMNIPVDFQCAKFCNDKNIMFRICGGENLENMSIDSVLQTGTLIG